MGNHPRHDFIAPDSTEEDIWGGDVIFIEKEWGSETIYCRSPHAAKAMHLKPGYQVSLHLHGCKNETFILISGKLVVETFSRHGTKIRTILEKPFDAITIQNMVPHTFYCPDETITPTIFIEASTQDTDEDNYRITKSGPRP